MATGETPTSEADARRWKYFYDLLVEMLLAKGYRKIDPVQVGKLATHAVEEEKAGKLIMPDRETP